MNTNSVPGIIKAIKILWQTCCVTTIEIVGNTLYIHNEPSLITVDVIYFVLLPFRQMVLDESWVCYIIFLWHNTENGHGR